MTEDELELEIQSKKLDAPRLTPELIDSIIVGETYTVLPSKRTMVCELTLKNGFTVRGESSCVSIENFNQELGEKISKADARDKLWQLEGYLLKQSLYLNNKD